MYLKPLRELSKEDWMEIGKVILILIGIIAIIRWVAIPNRPYCEDMSRIRAEVEAMERAIALFDDGKTNREEAINRTNVQMRYLEAVVSKCQCLED